VVSVTVSREVNTAPFTLQVPRAGAYRGKTMSRENETITTHRSIYITLPTMARVRLSTTDNEQTHPVLMHEGHGVGARNQAVHDVVRHSLRRSPELLCFRPRDHRGGMTFSGKRVETITTSEIHICCMR
jgi:hypothetical protein